MPLEALVHIANLTMKNPYFCLPISGDNTCFTNHGAYVQANLNPLLIPRYELANEVWNSRLGNYGYVISVAGSTIWYDWYAQRMCEMFALLRAQCPRVYRVIGSQHGSVGVTNAVLDSNTTFGKAWTQGDGVAIAPYFGYDWLTLVSRAGHFAAAAEGPPYDTLFDYLDNPDIPSITAQSIAQRNAINVFSTALDMIGYEGGQTIRPIATNDPATTEDTPEMNTFYTLAQRESRMGDCYEDWLAGCVTAGYSELYHFNDVFNPTKSGYWGAREFVGNIYGVGDPKYVVLKAFADADPDTPAANYANAAQLCQLRYTSFVDNDWAP